MVDIERIDHIGIVVDDLASALHLMKRAFGAHVWREINSSSVNAAFLAIGGGSLELIEFRDQIRQEERLAGAVARIDHLALEVDDLSAAIDRLKSIGFKFSGPPETVDRFTSVWTLPQTSDGVRYQLMQIEPAAGRSEEVPA